MYGFGTLERELHTAFFLTRKARFLEVEFAFNAPARFIRDLPIS